MIKTMVFIDFLNFQISLTDLYKNSPDIDYISLSKKIISFVDNGILLKTYLFHPKPDKFLMQDDWLKGRYDWINGTLNKLDYFEVIEGEYLSRPASKTIIMNIHDSSTYYKVEKGTDINIATQMLTKAFNNSLDVAILLSGDSDYIPVLKQLRNLGKCVILYYVEGQNINKLKPYVDKYVCINKIFLKDCFRENKNKKRN